MGARRAPSKKAIRKRAAENKQGLLPHEWLLAVMNGEAFDHREPDDDGNVKITKVYPTWRERLEAARVAAPYFAPKLATQTINANGGNEVIAEALLKVADRLPV